MSSAIYKPITIKASKTNINPNARRIIREVHPGML
jgi:hypothetical protein